MSGSAQRIWALVMRHIYIWRSSVMRLVDSIYWPAVQMVMWGFMTQYLLPQASFVAQAAGVLLSGLLLWEVVVRGNLSLSIAFLLSVVYLVVGFQIFQWFFRLSRRAGSLLGQGE